MKKIYTLFSLFLVLLSLDTFSQCATTVIASGGTSGNARCPSTRYRNARSHYLITAAEMAAAGFGPGNSIDGISWNYQTAPTVAGSGNLIVYLENTSDLVNTKSNSWPTAIASMQTAHNAVTALPAAAGFFNITFTGGTPFTYTGDGIYVAFDWEYCVGTLDAVCVVGCNTTLVNGLLGTQNAGACTALTALTASSFRPDTRFISGAANDVKMDLIYTIGETPLGYTTNHVVSARVTNRSNTVFTNYNVTLNVVGANVFNNVQTIASLGACASQTVTFNAFTPVAEGVNIIDVSVPPDNNNANNAKQVIQTITKDRYHYKYVGETSTGGVGFNNATGGVCAKFNTNASLILTHVNLQFTTTNLPYRIAIYGDNGGIPSTVPLYTDAADRLTINGIATDEQLNTPVTVPAGNFYVALHQQGLTNLGLSYTTEAPLRTGTFFFGSPLPITSWFDLGPNNGFRTLLGVKFCYPYTPVAIFGNDNICPNTTNTYSVTPIPEATSYTWTLPGGWSGVSNTNTITATAGLTGGNVTCVANYLCGGSTPAVLPVTVNSLPNITASANPATICPGGSSLISAGGGVSYSWQPGALLGQSHTVSPVGNTTYTVIGTDANGCSNASTVTLTVNGAPVFATLSPTNVSCNGANDGMILVNTPAPNPTFVISPLATQAPIGNFIGLAPNTYTITITDGNGCTAASTASISEPPALSVTASAGTITCNGGSATLTANPTGGTGPYTYQWIDGYTPGSMTIIPNKDNTIYEESPGNSNGAGEHYVAGNNGVGYAGRALISFDIAGNLPANALVNSASLALNCSQAHPLSGPQNHFLHRVLENWGEGTSNAFPPGGGALATANDATWDNSFFPTTNWANAGGSFSPLVTATTSVNTPGSYTWSSPQMVNDIQYWFNNPIHNYGWLLKGTESGSTQAKRYDSREHVTPANRPQLTIGYDVPNILGNGVNLNGATVGTYTLVVVDANGCTASTTITLSQPSPIVVTANITPSTTCDKTSAMPSATELGGVPPVNITWSGGLTNNASFVAMANATYTATATDANGCTGTSTAAVTVNPASGIIAPATSNQSQDHGDDFDINYYDASCDLIATVDDGAGGNILGLTTATVNVMANAGTHNGQPYVRRWYQITPTNNGAADVVLYINQSDFDDYNAAVLPPYLPLPTTGNNADPNIANIRITKNDDAGLGNNPIVITPAVNWNGTYWELSFNTPSFSQFRVHSVNPMNIPLPATITQFSGVKMETSDKLMWSTSSEQNNAYFNLQHSTDGKTYSTIAKVNSKAPNGNSQVNLNYVSYNEKPVLGKNYYRLQQVDIDNNVTIHNEIVITNWGADGSVVSLYPNPTSDVLNIDLQAVKSQMTTVKVMDMSGRVVKQIDAKTVVGMNNIKVNLGEFANGMYTVQVLENNQLTYTGKVRLNK